MIQLLVSSGHMSCYSWTPNPTIVLTSTTAVQTIFPKGSIQYVIIKQIKAPLSKPLNNVLYVFKAINGSIVQGSTECVCIQLCTVVM